MRLLQHSPLHRLSTPTTSILNARWRPLQRGSRTFLLPRAAGDKSATTPADTPTKPPAPSAQAQDREIRRALEDELRDPKNFVEYFLPRPIRLAFFGFSAASCLIACLINIARIAQAPSDLLLPGTPAAINLTINLIGLVTFAALFVYDQRAAEQRIERRKQVREAQIAFGDREVFVNEQGERMSRLKEVNDDWVLRRLERWGRKDGMPFVGPKKGAILQSLVTQHAPTCAVEVGTLCGYSAILMAQALPANSKLISIERDWKWVLVAKRFLWQASQGTEGTPGLGKKVDVWWGDAMTQIPKVPGAVGAATDDERVIDFLFLDGLPREYLGYLQAAEPLLKPGAVVVADNAGVFAQGGLKPYLEYVRSSGKYSSQFIESTLEWRDDVPDGMEVSVYAP